MPTLSNPTLEIKLDSTNNTKRIVTATVNVTFTANEKAAMQALGSQHTLKCHIWGKDKGEDSGTTGANDYLFHLNDAQKIDTNGVKTFTDKVNSSDLDEDDQFQDEIIARFTCRPGLKMTFSPSTSISSPKVSGSF